MIYLITNISRVEYSKNIYKIGKQAVLKGGNYPSLDTPMRL